MKSVLCAFCVGVLILAGVWYLSALEVKTNAVSADSDSRYMNITGETDIFELNSGGQIRPSVAGTISDEFEINSSGQITPKERKTFDQNASGQIQPMQ